MKRALSTLALAALLLALPAAAAELSTLEKAGTTLSWSVDRNVHSLHLTLSGPNGERFEKTFPGNKVALNLAKLVKGNLPDGLYTWELRENLPPRTRGVDLPSKRMTLAQSGVITIEAGSIVGDLPERPLTKDIVHADDVIITNSLCVGFDCVNGESFGFDTIRLKENNTRIKFEDTSTGSFPSNDWQLTANDSASGGQNKFSVEDITGARVPFTIEAGSTTNSIYVDSTGRVGFRTASPVLDLHVSTSNTPGMRLEQTNAGGFTAQTWDVAGNEANFFVRDVTGGSRLSFRIRPGAPTSSIDISADGDVGFGDASPDANVDIETSVVAPTQPMLALNNLTGPPRLEQTNGAGGHTWRQTVVGTGEFNVDDTLDGVIEFSLAQNGNLTISGNIISTNCPAGCGPDYVFAPDYDLLSLDELSAFIAENSHLPNVPSAKEMETTGIDMTKLQLRMLEKIEELTLYTLTQHRTIQEMQARLEAIETAE